MTLKELKERVDWAVENNRTDLDVCIPNGKVGLGGTSVTSVKQAAQGIDWDGGRFIIWPENKLIEFQEESADYAESINYIRRETGMGKGQIMFALEQCKEEIGVIISNWFRAHGKKTSEQSKIDAHYNSTDDYDSAQYSPKKLNNMNNNFTPYEESIELKDLGFDEPCMAFYELGNKQVQVVGVEQRYNNPELLRMKDFCAPLYQEAFRWFREKYNLICSVQYMGKNKVNWWDIYIVGHYNIHYEEMCMKYESYEEAELTCLKKLIEIAKTK